MNIEDVSDSEAYDRGFEDAFNGLLDLDNPYPMGSNAAMSWNDGFEAFFAAQEQNRRDNAKPKEIDDTLARLKGLSVEDVAELIAIPLNEWPGNCFGVASKLVEALEWDATAVYGHYLGPIAATCTMFSPNCVTHHGWVLTKQGVVVDPTRWVFEDVQPSIAIYEPWVADSEELSQYDEGGEQWLRDNPKPVPAFDASMKKASLLEGEGGVALQQFVSSYMSFASMKKEELTELSLNQIVWLANQPYTKLGTSAKLVYEWLVSIKRKGLIPIDFWMRAKREGLVTD